MQKASEYRQNAEECRARAKQMAGDHRDQHVRTDETWERLADDREARDAGSPVQLKPAFAEPPKE